MDKGILDKGDLPTAVKSGADLTGPRRGNQVVDRYLLASVYALLPLLLLATSCAEGPPPATWGEAVSLARLELGSLKLRPAASVGELPKRAPLLAPEAPQTRSVGPPHRGELLDGVMLVEAPGLAILPSAIRREALWGTPELTGVVTRAAEVVAATYPGSTLWVGDLSRRGGGPFSPHASHQSGRDVDLAFYLSSDDGVIADPPQMSYVDSGGAVGGLRFDVERNWRLVEAMLADPHAQLQWIFVANHLREALLERGREVGSPWVAKAERVLFEPRDSSPHADHFHVRIYCGLEDRLSGCLDAPPFHGWVDRHEGALASWLEGLLPLLEHPHQPETGQAIEAIVRMNASTATPTLLELAERVGDSDPTLSELARDAAAFLSGDRTRVSWERWRPRAIGY
jgi:penicillin-insensitive murein endopeptidase